jgi:hypothetical protein
MRQTEFRHPYGMRFLESHLYPAVNRRAIVGRPSDAGRGGSEFGREPLIGEGDPSLRLKSGCVQDDANI